MKEKQSKGRITKLVKEYPSLESVLRDLGRYSLDPQINIKVKRADENFLMLRGEEIDGKTSFITTKIYGQKVCGRMREEIYAIGSKNVIMTHHVWVGRRSVSRVMEILNGPWDKIKYIIFVRAYYFHEEIKNWQEKGLSSRFGLRVSRETWITVYLPPKKSFAELYESIDPKINVRLSMKDIMTSRMRGDTILDPAMTDLDQLTKLFEQHVYSRHLQEKIKKSKTKGMSGKFGSTKLISFCMAGRVSITLRRGDEDITFLAAEDGKNTMGLHSIDATLPTAQAMTWEVICICLGSPDAMKKVKSDTSVFIC